MLFLFSVFHWDHTRYIWYLCMVLFHVALYPEQFCIEVKTLLEILCLMALQDLIICMNYSLFTLSSYFVYVDFSVLFSGITLLERGIDWRDDQSRTQFTLNKRERFVVSKWPFRFSLPGILIIKLNVLKKKKKEKPEKSWSHSSQEITACYENHQKSKIWAVCHNFPYSCHFQFLDFTYSSCLWALITFHDVTDTLTLMSFPAVSQLRLRLPETLWNYFIYKCLMNTSCFIIPFCHFSHWNK